MPILHELEELSMDRIDFRKIILTVSIAAPCLFAIITWSI